MTKKDYVIIGMTIASTIAPYNVTLEQLHDIINAWSIALSEDNPRFNKDKFGQWVMTRWLIESK